MRQSPAGETTASSKNDESATSQLQHPVLKTGADVNSSNGLVATARIKDFECQITVDTGSNVSIVKPAILRKLQNAMVLQPVES